MYFLTIPFSFSAANIRPNDMIAGMPALSAVGGMAHNIQRVFQSEFGLSSFEVSAFSLVYFNMDTQDSAPKRPMQGVKDGKPTLPGLMDIRRGFGEAAVILYFDVQDTFEYKKFSELMSSVEGELRIKNLLDMHIRFAGGEIDTGTMGEYGGHEFKTFLAQHWEDALRKMMRAYPTQGLLLQDMSAELSKKALAEGVTSLEAMHSLLLESQVERYERFSKEKQPPIQVGERVEFPADHKAITNSETVVAPLEPVEELVMDDDYFLKLLSEDFQDSVEYLDESTPQDTSEDSVIQYLGTLLPAVVGFHEICEPRGQQYFVEPVLSLVRARVLPSVTLDITQGRAAWQNHFWCWQHLLEHQLHRTVSFSI